MHGRDSCVRCRLFDRVVWLVLLGHDGAPRGAQVVNQGQQLQVAPMSNAVDELLRKAARVQAAIQVCVFMVRVLMACVLMVCVGSDGSCAGPRWRCDAFTDADNAVAGTALRR